MLTQPALRLAALALPLLLAGCIGGGDRPVRKPVTQSASSAFSSPESRQCLADLGRAGVRYTPLANQDLGGGCGAIDSVKLLDIGTPVANLGAMTCPLARNFAAWVQYAVRPAARKYLDSEVVKVETFGTYSCRNVNGGQSGRLSQHAYANAVDVSAFVLADGRRITLLDGWQGAEDERQFLRTLHASACKRFGTVLGPDYNRQHANHFHFDMSGAGYCR
ncbi:MAG: extensin family protein [Sphingopyxis sp.]|nr:extensin family protein [Sphingopyxis sp.]